MRCATLLLAVSAFLFLCLPASAVTIDWTTVGNSGNARDQKYDLNGQYGAVAYQYRIGKYEVTNSQYAEFLDSKAASDPFNLYSELMGSDASGGITRSGAPGTFTYAVRADMANKPVNFIGWFDALRFTNWLNNGHGTGDTESGAYTLLGGTTVPSNWQSITRNPGATVVLPSEDEWYKAAYYDPRSSALGGPPGGDHYWLFPTQSDSIPTVAMANSVGDISNPGANVANYIRGADWNGQNGNVTTVGSAGPLSASFYGTYDQGGNVGEWTDTLSPNLSDRIVRGGNFLEAYSTLRASSRHQISLEQDAYVLGFRVVTLAVPEPSTLALGLFAAFGAFLCARKRRLS